MQKLFAQVDSQVDMGAILTLLLVELIRLKWIA